MIEAAPTSLLGSARGVIFANVAAVAVSIVTVLWLPKFMTVDDYGFFQLYLFYASYVGLVQLGWADGAYLRYGGWQFDTLSPRSIAWQFWWLAALQGLVGVGLGAYAAFGGLDPGRATAVWGLAGTVVLLGSRSLPMLILQATNRLREYSHVVLTAKVPTLVIMVGLAALGRLELGYLVAANLAAAFLSMALAFGYCRSLLRPATFRRREGFGEGWRNIRAGVPLLLSGIASSLTIGIIRLAIERGWGIAAFARVSLLLSVTALVLTFVNALGLVVFPLLKRTPQHRWPIVYAQLRAPFMASLLALVPSVLVFKYVLASWLPAYAEVAQYMLWVFPMFVFEAKNALLVVTLLKARRQERALLMINLASLALAGVLSVGVVTAWRSLDAAIATLLAITIFRTVLGEVVAVRGIGVESLKSSACELILVGAFVVSVALCGQGVGLVLFLVLFGVYLAVFWKAIAGGLHAFRRACGL